MTSARILVADDQPDVLEALRLLLKSEGFQVETVTSPGAVYRAVEARSFDLVLIDLNYARDTTSGAEGLALLEQLHAYDELLPVVVMTAWSSVDLAVQAMRLGARDFVQKPWENAKLLATIRTHIELGQALRKGQRLEAALRADDNQTALIAQSRAMQPVLAMIERIGPSDANVLITGENGTGKGVIARALHARSRRAASVRSFPSTSADCRSRSSRANYSDTSKARSPTRASIVSDASSSPTAARSFSTRWRTCRWRSRRSFCACSRPATSSASAPRKRAAPTCVSSPQPTRGSSRKSKRAAFARTCSSACAPSRSTCRRCAIAATTSRRWPVTSSARTRRAIEKTSPASTSRR